MIALTFDDGPHPRFTPQILSLLAQYNITATFFMIGSNVKSYSDIAKQVYFAGHEIGNHTFTHPHMRSISAEVLRDEIRQTEEILAQHGIEKPRLFRPPEGFRSTEQIAMTEDLGYRMVVWSLDTNDWQGRTAEQLVTFVLDHIRGGDVLLFHDYVSGRNTTITALEQLIPRLLEDGYRFVTVSHLMSQASAGTSSRDASSGGS